MLCPPLLETNVREKAQCVVAIFASFCTLVSQEFFIVLHTYKGQKQLLLSLPPTPLKPWSQTQMGQFL